MRLSWWCTGRGFSDGGKGEEEDEMTVAALLEGRDHFDESKSDHDDPDDVDEGE